MLVISELPNTPGLIVSLSPIKIDYDMHVPAELTDSNKLSVLSPSYILLNLIVESISIDTEDAHASAEKLTFLMVSTFSQEEAELKDLMR